MGDRRGDSSRDEGHARVKGGAWLRTYVRIWGLPFCAVTARIDFSDYQTEEQAVHEAAIQMSTANADARLRAVMDTSEGRSVLWGLLTSLGMFQPIATSDAMQLMRAATRRDVGLELWSELARCCPDQLALAKREQDE